MMTPIQQGSFTIAAVQAPPVFLDRRATVGKACDLIADAAKQGADLVVFPEAFIPGYPVWVWFVPAGHTHVHRELYARLLDQSVTLEGEEVGRLSRAARAAGVAVVLGVNERNAESSGTTLYNTAVFIGSDGAVLGRHRKLIPTTGERLVWGRGDGSDLRVHDVGFARVGALICWENYMPLARYALTAMGMNLLVAPTWDRGEPWLSTMRHSAKETRSVVVGSCQAFSMQDVPDDLAFKSQYLQDAPAWLNPGGSVIVDPDGKVIAGPETETETTLYAEVQRDQLTGPRFQLDTAGHYDRPDVFELRMHRIPRPGLTIVTGADEPPAPASAALPPSEVSPHA